ncbi:2-hydroxychromene-2-carboxylate isomerase [Polymorphobacter fuscus]|uniref:2-hydroxychromene-2-carboxylate isomerase n=1 Tax=Sandarakinorhabdus fusca TaxID=1439888 RepID=A0A7C9KHL1_9SPHN|nr:DsbA family protein [Polymorphobacter fuscus]KAB7648967.1 2-hydroxychromene-2-carboxylate isomerase [Polymorphobacter fuscus]MQT16561.1 2-hydroxychromene-2-carboxylate isomerase [Polymorphobacter fuscus]NJC07148.1 2-hydroxychromene-2-carboxylate isomerase [Polymorphobacter fuscus]
MTALGFDLFWSFRSPYSYLATPRLVNLVRDFDVACNVRIVYPIAVRQADFFANADPLWVFYLMKDTYRTAEFLGLPYRWPNPDPVLMDPATRTYPRAQPHIHRLSHLGVAAAERGRGLAFIAEVSALIWDGCTDNWHEGDHLAQAAARAGCDLAELDAAIAADPVHHVDVVETNQSDQRKGGHYGVPLMVLDGEPFFGQDRIDQLIWRLEQKGVMRR